VENISVFNAIIGLAFKEFLLWQFTIITLKNFQIPRHLKTLSTASTEKLSRLLFIITDKLGFFYFSTVDVGGWRFFCCGRACPGHYSVFSNIPGLYLLHFHTNPFLVVTTKMSLD
jgi:hypothetical protein